MHHHILMLLLLCSRGSAETPTWERTNRAPAQLHLARSPVSRLYRWVKPEQYLHFWKEGGRAWLDVYSRHTRTAHHPVGAEWLGEKVSLGELDARHHSGRVAWIRSGKALSLLVFPLDWSQPPVAQTLYDSEFSTTGWCTVDGDRDPATGMFRVDELHESPGEETENGRQMDIRHVYYEWRSQRGEFVAPK